MMVRCIRVPRSEGEGIRRALMEDGLLDLDFRIGSDGDGILIPVRCDAYRGYAAEEADLRPSNRGETDYKALVDVPEELRELLPKSFDVVGDIALMKLEDALLPYRTAIGEALMKVTPNIRAVFLDGGVKGEFRIRDLEKVAGTGTSETIHVESGARMKTDPSKVYFNPRLATERERVASLVADGEVVIDMFAGVAPFGTVICRHARPSAVYSIDLNPECEYFMRENMRLNRIGNMECIIGDAEETVAGLPKADRIIMNLPQMADRFLASALRALKPSGTVHLYKIMERADLESFREETARRMADEGLPMRFVRESELKTYSPTMSVYAFDICPDGVSSF